MVGRNEPCPCESGKKYKKCCLNSSSFKVKPSNQPKVIDYHLVGDGKTYVKKPGSLFVQLQTTDPKYTDPQIEGIFKEIFSHLKDVEHHDIKDKLRDCKHKLYAVKHHKTSIDTEIKERVEEFKKEYKANSGVYVEQENPKLIYETESFLFQVKSNLDLLTQALGCFFPKLGDFRTFKRKGSIVGGKVIKALEKNNKNLSDLFEENRRAWIQDMVDMRDTITHYSRLKGFNCFIEEPYRGRGTITIQYPTMPTGKRVDVYCQETYSNLCELYRNVFNIVKAGSV